MILVDDGSTDGTRDVLQRVADDDADCRVILHEENQGKGLPSAPAWPRRREMWS